jgi:hypothetical protein
MAMLTLDLPETPQAQPAYRLAADCPTVALPWGCARTARPVPSLRLQRVSRLGLYGTPRLPRADPQHGAGPGRPDAGDAGGPGPGGGPAPGGRGAGGESRQRAAERATLERTVRQLMALAHPDRWPDTPLAHELTVALVALRQTLQPGAKRLPSAGRSPAARHVRSVASLYTARPRRPTARRRPPGCGRRPAVPHGRVSRGCRTVGMSRSEGLYDRVVFQTWIEMEITPGRSSL